MGRGSEGLRARVERHIRRHELIEPGGEVTCLVSGGADSTCLWHVLRELGYRVSALHVNHGLRGAESDEDARFCRESLGAEVVDAPPAAPRPSCASCATRSRPTGSAPPATRPPTRSRPSSTGSSRAAAPAAGSSRGARTASCGRCSGSGARRPRRTAPRSASRTARDSSNADTKRGLIRARILPLLEELDPRARENLLALATRDEPPRLPRTLERTLLELLRDRGGTKEADLGGGIRAVREYDRVSPRARPCPLRALDDRVRPAGPRRACLAPRRSPRGPQQEGAGRLRRREGAARRERAAWPLVVDGDEVVCVPGIVETARGGVGAR